MENVAAPQAPYLQQTGRLLGHDRYAYGYRQPVLQYQVTVQGLADLPVERLSRLNALLATELETPFTPAQPTPERALVERLTAWTTAVLRRNGHPVFEPPRLLVGAASHVVGVLQPCLNLRACAQVVKELLPLVNQALDASRDDAALAESTTAAMAPLATLLLKSGLQGFNALHFLQAAHDLGVPWRQLHGSLVVLGHGAHARWLDSSWTDRTPVISSLLARDKRATAFMLRESGLPAPPHALAVDADDAVQHAEQLGYPVVVKPADLDGGVGVKAGLLTAAAVRSAFIEARDKSQRVLVEKHVPGRDYRMQVVEGVVQGVLERVPGGVVGNGVDSVETLLLQQNAERLNATDDRRFLYAMELDEEAEQLLARQGLDRHAVPPAGVRVRLRSASNVASGGVPVEVPLDRVDPDNLRLAVRATRALRLDVAGVDLLIPDIGRSWLDTGAHICEVNAKPQMFTSMHKPMLNRLMNGTHGRIPVVVVMEPLSSRAGLAQLVHRALLSEGLQAGLAQGRNLWLGADRVGTGGPDPLAGAGMLLLDTELQALVLAVGPADGAAIAWPVPGCELLLLKTSDNASSAPPDRTWFRRAMGHARYLRPAAVWVDSVDAEGLREARAVFSGPDGVHAVDASTDAARANLAHLAVTRLLATS